MKKWPSCETKSKALATDGVSYILWLHSLKLGLSWTKVPCFQLLCYLIPHALSTLPDLEWCQLIHLAIVYEKECPAAHHLLEFIFLVQHSRCIMFPASIFQTVSALISFPPSRLLCCPENEVDWDKPISDLHRTIYLIGFGVANSDVLRIPITSNPPLTEMIY